MRLGFLLLPLLPFIPECTPAEDRVNYTVPQEAIEFCRGQGGVLGINTELVMCANFSMIELSKLM